MTTLATEVRLASRPHGWPTAANFEIAQATLPDPAPGQVLVRNLVMTVDPYMRGRMNDTRSYVPPFAIGEALDGGAVGEIVSSTVDSLRPGDVVLHGLGWRSHALLDAKNATKVDPTVAPVNAYLGVLGMPGLTAYAGLLKQRNSSRAMPSSSPARPARSARWWGSWPGFAAPPGLSAAPAARTRSRT